MSGFGNVLVIGSAGVGKSTLIKTVLGSDVRRKDEGKRSRLAVYESLSVPFRIIDAGDVTGSFFAQWSTIGAIKRWSKDNALDGNADNDINVIWFCVEGKSRKLIREQIADLSRATDVWRSVPIIVVITKSYAALERADNVALVNQACHRRRRLARTVKAIVPVVATTYQLSETTFVPPEGIPELIEATNDLMPEGVQAAASDIAAFSLKRRRSVARSIIAASTAAGVTVGAVPIPISDALILTPIETAEVKALSTLYGIGKGSASKKLLETILEVGTVSTVAKSAISALKAVPGLTIGASALNAVIAGSIVAAIGEGTMRVFERIYLGERTLDDTEWVRSFLESRMSRELVSRATAVLGKTAGTKSTSDQRRAIAGLVAAAFGDEGESEGGSKAKAIVGKLAKAAAKD